MPMIKRTLLSATVTWEKYDYFQSVREDHTCSAFQLVTTDQMGKDQRGWFGHRYKKKYYNALSKHGIGSSGKHVFLRGC